MPAIGTEPAGVPAELPRRVCFLSRSRGWIDPEHPRRPIAEVNLFAVYQGHPMWTLETTWSWAFGNRIPKEVERAYRNASVRMSVSESEVRLLQGLAERLHVELRIVE